MQRLPLGIIKVYTRNLKIFVTLGAAVVALMRSFEDEVVQSCNMIHLATAQV